MLDSKATYPNGLCFFSQLDVLEQRFLGSFFCESERGVRDVAMVSKASGSCGTDSSGRP